MRLVPVSLPQRPVYFQQGLPGALRHAFLAVKVNERLIAAAARIHAIDPRLNIVVLDALRSRATQRGIRDRYALSLRSDAKEPTKEELDSFVADPDETFVHGTGGAVDIWLLRDGAEVDLGVHFDQFDSRSAPDFYARNPPRNATDRQRAADRQLMVDAMLEQDFVVLNNEFWHFEYLTTRWAAARNAAPILTAVIDPPNVESVNLETHALSPWPMQNTGVAPAFLCPPDRQRALNHESGDPYYVRASSLLEQQLLAELAGIIDTPSSFPGALFPSGLSAASYVFRSLDVDHIIVGGDTYYEVTVSAKSAARRRQVSFEKFEPAKSAVRLDKLLRRRARGKTLVWVDSPSNWFLVSADIAGLAAVAHSHGAILAVDTSVAPTQRLFQFGADIVTISLSKYPSCGTTSGGALFGRPDLFAQIAELRGIEGTMLAQEAVQQIFVHTKTLPDRIAALKQKRKRVVSLLKQFPFVRSVQSVVGSGQIVFHVDPAIGTRIEEVAAANAALPGMPKLMCTFGAYISSIEHYGSNPRFRTGLAADRAGSNEAAIPETAVRLSIGSEPTEKVLAALRTLLWQCQPHYVRAAS
jgi:cystathionine beta-lyase/cystathionine gamma-synthase/D-alanyl-D-alanine dipeptidase